MASRTSAALREADFALGGMDVHIHGGGVHVDEEEGDRVLALHEGGVVALAQGEVERAVFHGAAIEEDELLRAGTAAHARFAEEAADADVVGGELGHLEQFGGESRAAEVADALAQMIRGGSW